jgi:D-xylose transport system substrate-binding protein
VSEIDSLMEEALAGRLSRRQFMHRAFMLGVSGSLLSMGLAACRSEEGGGGGGGGGEEILVGFSFTSFEHFRWPFDRKFFENRADELKMKYVIQGAEEDPAIQEQQVEAMLAQGIKALVIVPVNIEAGAALVERVKQDADIPVISYNYVIPSAAIDYWTARNNFQVGELQANKALEEAEKGNWAVVSGPAGVDVAQQKTEGAMRILQPHVDSGEITIVSQEFHDAWSPEGALNQIENALTRTKNDLKAVVANEDGLALGSLQALTEQGLDGKVWLCGEDVFPEVAQKMVAGEINASAWTDLIKMGASAANAAYALARGETPESNDKVEFEGTTIPGMRIESRLVTKENLAEFIELTGWLKPEDVGL